MFIQDFDTWLGDASISSWLEDGVLMRTSSRTGKIKSLVASAATAAALVSTPVHAAQVSRVSEAMPVTGPPTVAAVRNTDDFDNIFITTSGSTVPLGPVGSAPTSAISSDRSPFEIGVLNADLKRLREVGATYTPDAVAINPRSVRIARIVSHQLQSGTAPTVGVDDEGNVFFHFKNDHAEAFLTIEPRAMHLFCKVAGKPNVYIDDEPLAGKRLPIRIRRQLSDLFA